MNTKNYKGLQFTAKDFKWAFNMNSMKDLNTLIKEGKIKVVGKTKRDNENIYEVIK